MTKRDPPPGEQRTPRAVAGHAVSAVRPRQDRLGRVLVPLLVLATLVVTTVAAALVPRPTVLAALLLVSVVWLRVNGPVEGPVLVAFSDEHGLTLADLAVLAAWGAVGGAWLLRHPSKGRRTARR